MDSTLSLRNHFDSIIGNASRLTDFVSRQMKMFNEPITILKQSRVSGENRGNLRKWHEKTYKS